MKSDAAKYLAVIAGAAAVCGARFHTYSIRLPEQKGACTPDDFRALDKAEAKRARKAQIQRGLK